MEGKYETLAGKIAGALGGSSGPDASGNYLCCCPAHADENPSLSICGRDGALLVNCFAGCSGPAVFAALFRRGLYVPPDEAAPKEPEEPEQPDEGGDSEEKEGEDTQADPAAAATKARAEEQEKKLAAARAKFSQWWPTFDAQSALHATVGTYCDCRGVARFATAPTWLRFTPSGLHVGKDKNGVRFDQFFPMLVVAGENPTTGELYGGQREYLAYGGRGFAPVDKKERKKTTTGCSLKGAVARIAEPVDGEFLLVGEGWVTIKTAMDATALPGWSVFGVSGLTSFDPPDNVKAILFLAENDADGKNAKALKVVCPKLYERGIKIGVAKPPAGLGDLNELVRLRDDGTRLHGTVEAGLKIVRDIIEKAKTKARSKDDAAASASAGSVMPPIDLPGMDGEDDEKTFSMTPAGLFRGRTFISGLFEVVAQSRIITDGRATDWGLRIRFKNPDGAVIEEPIAARDLYGEPMRLSAELASLGMDINNTAAAKSALATYLGSIKVKDRALIATRTGWAIVHGKPVFVLPNQTIGAGSERVVLAGDGRTVVYAQAGTLDDWKMHIGNPAGAHLLVQFGIAVAFAATLLQMSGGESGGFHLHEFSSKGKTTAQQVAASVWGSGALHGGFIRRWRATANSLEASFAAASDTCLILDEMSQAGYGEVSAIIYSVTGEVGKGRLRSDATARNSYSWRTLILSSGETSSAARLEEDRYQKGGRSRALRGGATVRFIDIPADREFGAFDRPVDESDFNPATFAERMQEMASIYYGTAGPAFVTALLDEKISAADVRQTVSDFIVSVCGGATADEGQARRVARRFGLVAAAGLMAIGAGIVDWDRTAFLEGVKGLFRGWAKAKGDGGPVEEAQILEIARSFFSHYGESRFDSMDETPDLASLRERPVADRAGYRTGRGADRLWFVFPQIWKEIFTVVNPRKAAAILHAKGMVERGVERDRFAKKVQLGDLKRQSFYVVNQKIFEGWDEPDAASDQNDKKGPLGDA